jgi:hypothetical protein
MKMLISQEMAREGDTNQKTINVVGRLMGLDSDMDLPKPVVSSNRTSFMGCHLSVTLARVNNQMLFEKHTRSVEDVQYKDVYEVRCQSRRGEFLSNGCPLRMDLVRQKFVIRVLAAEMFCCFFW